MAASDTRSKRTFVVRGVNRSVMAGSVQELGPAGDDRLVTQVLQVVAGLLHDGCRSRRRSPVGQRLSFQLDKGSLQALERHLFDCASKRPKMVAGGWCVRGAQEHHAIADCDSCRPRSPLPVTEVLNTGMRTGEEASSDAEHADSRNFHRLGPQQRTEDRQDPTWLVV
jgi:hypothetical protein